MAEAADALNQRRVQLQARFAPWTPMTLGQMFASCAREFGDRPLVITDETTLTYTCVDVLSRQWADGLAALGVRAGSHIGLLMANYAEFVPLKIAIARAGAVAVPLNFRYRADELAYVLGQSRCEFLITMSGFGGLDYLDMLDVIVPGWDTSRSGLKAVVVLPTDGRSRAGATDLDALAALGTANPGASLAAARQPTDVSDVLYTSGSTGTPKGACLSHDAILRTGFASALTRGFQDGRRILTALPCYHMFGLIEGVVAALYVGGAIVPQTAFSAEAYFAGIEQHRVHDVLCVPTMAVAMLESDARHDHDLSSLQAILCGSAPAPIWLWENISREFGVDEIVTGYGMTEVGGAMTMTRPEDPHLMTSTTVGRLKMAGAAGIDGTGALAEYRTVDPDTGEFLPPGQTGELVSRGSTTMLGFWDDSAETARVLRDGWLHSGDIGRVRPDGYVELTGRIKELYKSGGELVMPREIEDVLGTLDGVSQVFAIGVPDDRWGEMGCVIIVRTPEAALDAATVLDHCRSRLARFKVPRRVVFLDAEQLPVTANGKVQKFKLAALVSAL